MNTIRMDVNGAIVWINNNLVQGAMLLLDLLNRYINDLIKVLEIAELCNIAYADDLSVLCDGEDKLNLAMRIIQEWGIKIDITVNKKEIENSNYPDLERKDR